MVEGGSSRPRVLAGLLLGKKSISLHIGIFMNDLATEIKNVGLGITVEDHDPCGLIMHKSKTKLDWANSAPTYPQTGHHSCHRF